MSDRTRLDERTDRLARRLMGYAVPRDTYFWARLRLGIALRDTGRVARRELFPAVRRLDVEMQRTGAAINRLAAALRR